MKHFSTKQAFNTAIKDMQKIDIKTKYLLRQKQVLNMSEEVISFGLLEDIINASIAKS